jgi:hypothetical protein
MNIIWFYFAMGILMILNIYFNVYDLSIDSMRKNGHSNFIDYYEDYRKLPSYNQMVYKFWIPLDSYKIEKRH